MTYSRLPTFRTTKCRRKERVISCPVASVLYSEVRKKEEGRGKKEEGRRLKSVKKRKFPVDIHS
ncbi:hypothetical protein [Okeania sp. KiyG1]|uniref:hypothetical protein n=1 Tax=Okeania sp. KiyG1 TaxID=2720165 RepID=UPI001F195C93|nr:hypothetical protein [Okeania sp. KiyG1]